MFWESVSELACVCGQVHVNLLHLFDHLLSGAIIRAELAGSHVSTLIVAAYNAPQDEVRNICSDRSRKGREDVGFVSNLGCVTPNIEG